MGLRYYLLLSVLLLVQTDSEPLPLWRILIPIAAVLIIVICEVIDLFKAAPVTLVFRTPNGRKLQFRCDCRRQWSAIRKLQKFGFKHRYTITKE